ncbi:MAG TPA: hypothetical protein VGF69_11710 [Thermoanaerobaculia bacterium]
MIDTGDYYPSRDGSRKSHGASVGACVEDNVMTDATMNEQLNEQRKALARQIVGSRFPITNPELDIRDHLDEPGEQIALADFLNRPIAKWVAANTPFVWIPIHHSELSAIHTVRDFGKVVLAHLALKPRRASALTEEVFDGPDGGA